MSSEFNGVYSPDDVAMSAFDELALGEASLQDLRAFLLRQAAPTLMWHNQSISELRWFAWESILRGRHDPSETLTVAREVMAFDPSLKSYNELSEQLLRTRHSTWEANRKSDRRMHGFILKEQDSNGNTK